MKPENRALLIGHDSRTYRGSPEETEAKDSSDRARFPHIAPRLGRNHEDGQFWSGPIPGDSHAFAEEVHRPQRGAIGCTHRPANQEGVRTASAGAMHG